MTVGTLACVGLAAACAASGAVWWAWSCRRERILRAMAGIPRAMAGIPPRGGR